MLRGSSNALSQLEETLSVISVSYRNSPQIAGMLRSLENVPGIVRICVVDNYPDEPVQAPFSDDRVQIINNSNNGYARGVNRGVRAIDSRYVLLLNPDITYSRGDIPAAVRRLGELNSAAILAPMVLNFDGSRQYSVRKFYTLKTALYARSPWRNDSKPPSFFREYLMQDFDHDREMEVDWALGGALLIDRLALKGGEIFDPRYFMYFEDVELCYDCWRRGKKVLYYPDLVFYHEHHRASSRQLRFMFYHMISFLRFVIKHRGLPGRPSGPDRS